MIAVLLIAILSQGGVSPAERAAFKAAADSAADSVVRIETLGGADTAGGQLVSGGPTSGVVVSADGLILTSSFAFLGDPTGVLVRLPDGRRVAGERLGTDESRLVTLLRVDADGLTPAVPADPAGVRVGDWAVAVGRTYAAEAVNLSVGVVSATGRILGRAVQTDAKTSPANYGGVLVNLAGETLGVLAPLTGDGGTGGVEWYDSGIGFAVPLTDVLPVLDRLEAGETLRPGLLGVTFAGAALDAAPVVESVRPRSPAEVAGLRPGDRFLEVTGVPVDRPDAAKLALGPLRAGDAAGLVVERGEERVELTATLAAELPPVRPGELGVLPGFADGDDEPAGVPVAFVFPDSPAAAAGLAAGDVITAAGDEPVRIMADLRRVVSRAGPDAELTLTRAGGEPATVTLAAASADPPASLPDFAEPDADPLPEDRRGRVEVDLPQFQAVVPVFVPDRTGRGGFALLVVLTDPAADGKAIPDALADAAAANGLIVAAPSPANAAGWRPDDLPRLAAAVERVVERYGVDPARVSLLGRGAAGRVAWAVAASTPETYRGWAAPADAAPPRLPENDAGAPRRVLLLGSADADASGDAADALDAAGYPHAALAVPADGPVPPDAAAALARWAAAVDRI